MAKSKRECITNEDFVRSLMNYSPYGALCQVFVLEALDNYATRILNTPNYTDNDTGFISKKAWFGIAQDIKDKITTFYGKKVTDAVQQ